MDPYQVKSPVTGEHGVKLFDTIAVKDIESLYLETTQTPVRRHFDSLNEIKVLECEKTGYRFYYPYEIAGDAEFYEQLQMVMDKREMYYRPWGYDHQYAYDHIKPGTIVLDVGCGSGNFLKRIKEKTNSVVGLEFNNAAIEKCKQQGFEVYPDTIQKHADDRPGYYDVVCLFQVLEHIADIKPFLEACLKTLKKGGKLIIGVPSNEPYLQGYNKYSTLNLPPHHMGLWNAVAFESIQALFNIKLVGKQYESKGRLMLDAYFRVKYWLNIKSTIHRHSLGEKIKMFFLAPFSVVVSCYKKITKGINGRDIVVEFEKQ
jgi:2-polyprenyl-3-methyl-5-hydroxy-6-metoxy-1,4-benzoquinol methylase